MHFSLKAAAVSLIATGIGVALIFRVPAIKKFVTGAA